MPRDAASYRVEVLHLAAIRAHRRERAVSAAHTVSEALAKVTAVVTSATQPAATCAQPAAPCTQPAAPRAQVWGAFWTVPMPPATGAVRFCLHRSLIFTEPLLGCVELPLHELTQDNLCTQWHPLRAKGQRGEEILGEARRPHTTRRPRASSPH